MSTTLSARLDKTGRRVLCGRPGCGRELARVETIPAMTLTGFATSGTGMTAHQHGEDMRYVQMGPGWQQDEQGRWSLTKRAQERLSRDQYRAARGDAAAQERLATGRTLANRRPLVNQYTGALNQARNGLELPAEVRCPRCSGVNRLDGGALRASSRPTG